MSEQNITPFYSNQNQESTTTTIQQQPSHQVSYPNQIVIVNRQEQQQHHHQQQQHRQQISQQQHRQQISQQQHRQQIIQQQNCELQQTHRQVQVVQQQLQQPHGHQYHPQQQQQLQQGISELKSNNFIASIPTTDGKKPTLGFQIKEILPSPALPVKLFGDLYETSDPALITAALSSNQQIQATQGCRDGTNSPTIDGLCKCFHTSYKSLLVCHPILRYQDTVERIFHFPLPTPLKSLKQSLFSTKVFCISRNSTDLSDLKIEPIFHNTNQLETKILAYKYNRNLGEAVEFNPQIRIDYKNQVDFGPVESTLGFKAIKRNNQLPPALTSTTTSASQSVVVLQQQNYKRNKHSTSTVIVSQITPAPSTSRSNQNQTNGFIIPSLSSTNTPNIKSASNLVMMHKNLNTTATPKGPILCNNCGIVNSNSNNCLRCSRTLDYDNVVVEEKQQLTVVNTNKRDSRSTIDLTSEPPNKKIKQPMESNNNHSLNNSNHLNSSSSSVSSSTNDSLFVRQKNSSWELYSQDNAQLIEKFNELKKSSNSTEQFTTLECRSIRIGQYKVLSSSINKESLRVLFSATSGIYFKVSHASNGDIIECAVPISEVLHCYGHLKHRLPVLFIYTGKKCGYFLENKLGITNESQPQPPCIAIESELPNEIDELLIRKVFGPNYTDIEYIKANKILVTMAAVNTDMNGNNNNNNDNKKKSNSSSSVTATSTTVVTRNPTTRAQKNFQANLATVADLNKTESSSLLPIPNLGMTITTRDIACLNDNSFLNDNIIDFYLHHLYQNNLTPEQQEKCFIYPTHFFYLLNRKRNTLDKKPDKSSSAERKHVKVAKITKDVDIFSKDFLFIPICESFHWYLAVICFPGLKGPHDLETNEELPDFKDLDKKAQAVYPKKVKQPLILIFDSLCDNRGRIITLLRDYLQVEYKTKKSDGFLIDKNVMGGHMPKAPQQTNAIDCGLFVLDFFRYFYQDPMTDYKVSTFSFEKKRWFHPTLPANLRKIIFDTLYPLIEENNPDELNNLPQVAFPAYVDPTKVKFVIKAKKKGPSAAVAALSAGAGAEASTSSTSTSNTSTSEHKQDKSKVALRPVILSSFSIACGPKRSITTTNRPSSSTSSSPSPAQNKVRKLNSEQLTVKPPVVQQQPEEEEEEEELMDL